MTTIHRITEWLRAGRNGIATPALNLTADLAYSTLDEA